MRPSAHGDPVVFATKTALRTPGPTGPGPRRRRRTPSTGCSASWSKKSPPDCSELHGVGVDTAAALLVTAGDNPDRLRCEAAWAHLCGVSPIEASSGKVTRLRLNRGGDRQANSALWGVVITRLRSDPRTQAYMARRLQEGRSKPEIIRVLKRYVAREVYKHLPR